MSEDIRELSTRECGHQAVYHELRERLAALAHEQWSGWMLYMLGDCDRSNCPAMRDPDEPPKPRIDHPVLRARWQRQMDTVYVALPDAEKESDRKEADRVLAIIAPLLQASIDADLRAEIATLGGIIAHEHLRMHKAIDALRHIAASAARETKQPRAELDRVGIIAAEALEELAP